MKTIRMAMAALALAAASRAEVSPEELIRAVDRMSPEQALALQQTLEAKLWQPVPPGFFHRMAADVGASWSVFDTVGIEPRSLSGGALDVDAAGGLDVGVLWRVAGDRLRVGLRFATWAATDSDLGEGGYSRADLEGGNVGLAVNYQWVRTESWLLWTEVVPAAGSIALETVDTPAGGTTTLREFDGTYGEVAVQAGVSLRINPAVSVFLSGGYRFAESIDLEEGGRERPVGFDASGFTCRVGLGINF
jgi:hypothetical protein